MGDRMRNAHILHCRAAGRRFGSWGPLRLALLVVAACAGAARPSRPSPEEIAHCEELAARRLRDRAAARPWLEALFSQSVLAQDSLAAEQLFLATYKHYDEQRLSGRKLEVWAEDIAAAWRVADSLCRDERLRPSELARAVCRLTNSDFGPVGCSRGRGTDSVRSGSDLLEWARTLIGVAVRAKKAGLDSVETWERLHRSYQPWTPTQLDFLDVTGIPPGPKW